jgi:hypothetical protein
MRKKVSIKRTFPKTKSGKGAALVNEVSAMEQKISKGNESITSQSSASKTDETPTGQVETSSNTSRRRSDSSMDMFRNMAKEINK